MTTHPEPELTPPMTEVSEEAEREAFERLILWCAPDCSLVRLDHGGYAYPYTQASWEGYLERARISHAEIAGLRMANEALTVAVQMAQAMFRHYGNLHAAKPDLEKAKRNYEIADQMAAALTPTAPKEPDNER